MFFFLYFFLLGTIVDIFAKYRSSLDIEQSWLTYLEKGHTLREKKSQEKVPAFQASPDGGKVVPVSTPIGGAQLKETKIKTARRERIQLGPQEGLEQGEQQRASEAAATPWERILDP